MEKETTERNSTTMITADNVVAGYRDKIVWRDANFAINRGEFVAVIDVRARVDDGVERRHTPGRR